MLLVGTMISGGKWLDLAVLCFVLAWPCLGETRIRAMTANLTSGKQRTYDNGNAIRIFQGLKPDVVLIQEWVYRDSSVQAAREFVDRGFGRDFHYFKENAPPNHIPNGIISRFPILDAGQWDDPSSWNRDFVWARLDIPGDKELFVYSVHFSSRWVGKRVAQAEALVEHIRKQAPRSDYLLIGGDLNVKSEGEEALQILGQLVVDRHVPVCSHGICATSYPRTRRLDRLLPSSALDKHHSCVEILGWAGDPRRVGYNIFPEGLVFDSRSFKAIHDVHPVKRSDSDTEGTEHMGVVKDFAFPAKQ